MALKTQLIIVSLLIGSMSMSELSMTQANILFAQRPIPPHQYLGGWEHYVGGGIATFDCNQDWKPDVFIAGGTNQSKLLINTTNKVAGHISFAEQTPATLSIEGVVGAYPIDINDDDQMDLVILRVGTDYLLQGDGQCHFKPFKNLNFQADDVWSTAFSATWEDQQHLPTLAFGTYVDRDDPTGPFQACSPTLLYRPDEQQIQYASATLLQPGYCALSMLFTDWQRQGKADLRISNDRHYYVRDGHEQLWQMSPKPREYTQFDGWLTYRLWGMGIASMDVNGDGFNDVFLTSMADQWLQFFDSDGSEPRYINAPYEIGTSAHRPYLGDDGRPSTGWHVNFGDVNNDGLVDLFISKGNVEQMPDSAIKDPNNLLIQQASGRFQEYGEIAGVASMHRGRGAALVDFNLDGLLDWLVVNRRANAELFENQSFSTSQNGESTQRYWLNIRLAQAPPNRHAVGAYVEVKTIAEQSQHTKTSHQWVQELTVGGGHASGQATGLHFGLGNNAQVLVRVIWPDQTTGNWQMVNANQYLLISKNDPIRSLW